MSEDNVVKPIAMPGTHERFLEHFDKLNLSAGAKILDIGAGHGAFSKRLHEMGFEVHACDLFPEIFHYKEVECKKVDITKPFPYERNQFDLVLAIEVSEHILDHENLFKEAKRVLKSDGRFCLSTPNVLSLKSRVRYLFGGFFSSFHKLDYENFDGLQHVNARSLDQYGYCAVKNGFKAPSFEIDRKQSTSKWIYLFIGLFMAPFRSYRKVSAFHNQKKLLLGRLLFLTFEKK
jgi:SAM-dependent methyltransferase